MDYQNYTMVDFALDENFRQWVKRPNEISDKCWYEWLEQHPHQRKEAEEARYWILLFKTLGECPPPFQLKKEEFWQQIMNESRKITWESDDCAEQSA